MKSLVLVTAVFFVLAIALPLSAQKLDGEWTILKGELSGQPVSESVLKTMSLNITKSQFEAKSGDNMSKGNISNISRSNPPQLVFTIDAGADSGREIKAIYKLRRGVLKIAYSQTDEFPENFTSTDSNRNLLLTYEDKKANQIAKDRKQKFPEFEWKIEVQGN